MQNKIADKKNTTKDSASRRLQVRKSGVHGRGIFAVRSINEGEKVLEYKGEIITWRQAKARHPHNPAEPNHTFYFHLDERHVIDGKYNGNWAKWINHSYKPNLEAEQEGMRIFLKALRNIEAGEELFYDYALMIEERLTSKLKKEYACLCGAAGCRGTLLACKR